MHKQKRKTRLGAEAYICNPSILRRWGGQITFTQEFETSLGNMVKPHLYKKYRTYLSGLGGMPVVTATQEAEVGGSFEPRRQKL